MPPQCVFVTGPRGAGKTRWVQENILKLVAAHPGLHCAVVLAEDGHTRMERFAHEVPDVAVRRVLLPCPCCPAHAYLPETIRQLTSETGADWLFVETPAVATAGLLGEFDRSVALGPRLHPDVADPQARRLCSPRIPNARAPPASQRRIRKRVPRGPRRDSGQSPRHLLGA